MATSTRVVGPIALDFAPGGLAPGDSAPTVWTTDPPLGVGTVTFTALAVQFQGSDDGARLAIRDPTVQIQKVPTSPTSDIFIDTITLHAVVANVGESTVFSASMFISFLELTA